MIALFQAQEQAHWALAHRLLFLSSVAAQDHLHVIRGLKGMIPFAMIRRLLYMRMEEKGIQDLLRHPRLKV